MSIITRICEMVGNEFKNIRTDLNTFHVQELKVGSASNQLTATILDNLVALQDGSDFASGTNSHTHNGLYYLESEMTDRANGQGCSLLAVERKAYSNITGYTALLADSLANYNIQALLDAVNTSLATAGSSEFSDALFRIQDDGDPTKEIDFQASGITTGTKRTITMPDANVDLGQIATNTSNISTNTTHATGDGSDHSDVAANSAHAAGDGSDHADVAANSAHAAGDGSDHADVAQNTSDITSLQSSKADDADVIKKDGSVAFTGPQSMGSQKLTSLAAGTASGDAVNKSQLDAVQSSINNFDWQETVKDYIVDNTAAPPTEVSGDRYMLSHDGGAPHANYDGASAGDIVEFNGTTWDAYTPASAGIHCSVHDEGDSVRVWGGAAWDRKYYEATTASTGLTKVGFDIRIADANAGAIQISGGAFSVNVDDVGIEVSGNALQLKDGGVVEDKIGAGAVTEDKIGALAVTEGKIGAGAVTEAKIGALAVTEGKIGTEAVTAGKIGADAVTKTKLNADVVGTDQGLAQETDGSLRASGLVQKFTNGNAGQLSAGAVVRISGDLTFDYASANSKAAADSMIGILLETTASGAVGKVLTHGYATATGGGAWTANDAIFLTTTEGQVADSDLDPDSNSGKFARRVGYAVNSTQFFIDTGMTIEIT